MVVARLALIACVIAVSHGARGQAMPQYAPALIVDAASLAAPASRTSCSALAWVKPQCEGHIRCSLATEAPVCGPQQAPLASLFLKLTVTYRCSPAGGRQTVAAERPFRLNISCASLLR